MKTKIKQVIDSDPMDDTIIVEGSVRSIRDQGATKFIMLHDGTSFNQLQIVVDEKTEGDLDLSIGSTIVVTGTIQISLGKKQRVDLLAKEVIIIGDCPQDYPIQKKGHSMEFLRSVSHLRSRTNTFSAIFRIRAELEHVINSIFHENGFIKVHTPIITGNDSEGAGEMFQLKTGDKEFFKKDSFLTVSGQLHLETLLAGLGNVYTFNPAFRAENSNTSRHAAEFWMIEPEMKGDLNDMIFFSEYFIKEVIARIVKNCSQEMEFCNSFIENNLLERLEKVVSGNFGRISYTEAVTLLNKSKFNIKWGDDLQSEQEKYLTDKIFKKPVYVTNYPKVCKAFYMKTNEDSTVSCTDLLVPSIGELFGGSQREDDYDKLKKRIIELNMPVEHYDWYLDLRKYGKIPSSGFGMGFERLVMYITGVKNIRDTIPFPRVANSLSY